MESTNLDTEKQIKIFMEKFKLVLEDGKNINKKFLTEVTLFIKQFVKLVERFCNEKHFTNHQYFSVVVYLMDCCSAYQIFTNWQPLYLSIEQTAREIEHCIRTRLLVLLDKSTLIFDNEGDKAVGSFLSLMDVVLDKIGELDIKEELCPITNISNNIEEILCLSMSIAQIGYGDDNKIITASCRTVLNSMENLKSEGTRDVRNPAMFNLVSDALSDSLCALEARVNTAVLRLCLYVFSEYKKPVDNLFNSYANKNGEFNSVDFDLYMDRVFQICLFSIASSTIGKGVADIKNVMANLEFLEGELVPSFLAASKDPSRHRVLFADILKKVWIGQMKMLRAAVHEVIEPSAYCKLVSEELKQKLEDLWENNLQRNIILQAGAVDAFILFAKELGLMFTKCMDSFDVALKDEIKTQLDVVYKVLKELIASKNLYFVEKNEESLDDVVNKKIFKRCQVLQVSIRRLWLCTVNEKEEEFSDKTEHCNKTSVVNMKNGEEALQNIIAKSKFILKDRSMAYINATFSIDPVLNDFNLKRINGKCLHHKSTGRNFFFNNLV